MLWKAPNLFIFLSAKAVNIRMKCQYAEGRTVIADGRATAHSEHTAKWQDQNLQLERSVRVPDSVPEILGAWAAPADLVVCWP